MIYKMKINETTVLVAELMTTPFNQKHEISNFVLVNGKPIYVDNSKTMHGLSVDEYKKSHKRGLFKYVTHADVIRCNLELLRKAH